MSENQNGKKHPNGLYVLFTTEMWERFGFYLMLGILYLYMTDKLKGGLGFDEGMANEVYGTYIALVYLTPFIGGLLADRIFGYRKMIIAGGALMGLGYFCLAIPGLVSFYCGLALIIMGNGLFKPNISTLLGNLYNKPQYLSLKNQGYNIFYMGINIGAFVCNFVAAPLRNLWGWPFAFAAAGAGMFIGLAIFIAKMKKFDEYDVLKPATKEDMPLVKILMQIFAPALAFAIVGYFVLPDSFAQMIHLKKITIAFLLSTIPVAFFYIRTYTQASEEDKRPIGALLSVMGVVVIFWMIFHQNGNVLTNWAERYTTREMPEWAANVLRPTGYVQEVEKDTSYNIVKDKSGNVVLAQNAVGEYAPGPLAAVSDMPSFTRFNVLQNDTLKAGTVEPYLFNLPQADWPKEKPVTLANTELFQSINPGFVVLFTPLVLAFFGFLARRKREPSTPAKIGYVLFITGLSTLVMVAAVTASHNGADKVSWTWLLGTYAVITIGELFLSPMGLSLVHKLSPPRLTAIMMGGWFLSTAIGNKLSGVLGSLNTAFEDKRIIFIINFGGALLAAVMLFMLVKFVREVVREKTGAD